MLKSMIVILSFICGTAALAHPTTEVLSCSITEPFLTYTYDQNWGTLTLMSAETAPAVSVVSRNAKFVSLDSDQDGVTGSQYQVVDTVTGDVLIELTMSGQGSDGMSDQDYLFEAVIDGHFGGCSTTSAPAVNKYNIIYSLQGKE